MMTRKHIQSIGGSRPIKLPSDWLADHFLEYMATTYITSTCICGCLEVNPLSEQDEEIGWSWTYGYYID